MVRTINIYYNNRSVQAVVELKNKPGKLVQYVKDVHTILMCLESSDGNICKFLHGNPSFCITLRTVLIKVGTVNLY
jgi:hypothetical protein